MKEHRIIFEYRPGTNTQIPEHVFVELEDENGKSTADGAWEGCGSDGLVALVIPNYKEERDKLLALANKFMIITSHKRIANEHGFLGPHQVSEHRRLTKKLIKEIREAA